MPSITDICTLDTSDDKLLENSWNFLASDEEKREKKKKILNKCKTFLLTSMQLRIANYNDSSSRISCFII